MRHLDRSLLCAALVAGAACARLSGQAGDWAASEALDPPTPARLRSIEAAGEADGWQQQIGPLHDMAVQAYARNRYIAADAWYHLYSWALVFATPEQAAADAWVQALARGGGAYEGFDAYRHPGAGSLGSELTASMRSWLLEHEAFSAEFFGNLSTEDYLPRVLSILGSLHQRDPGKFERYASLCIAIALVYDMPPPRYWPHAQVSERCLSRGLLNPAEPFEWLTREDMMGHTLQRLSGLKADELKFVVDMTAPAQERQWAVANVYARLDHLADVYGSIRYRDDRAASDTTCVWTSGPYTLQAIRQQGGICIDQAYFATQVGKARGVPTILFTGVGQDSRHAWFGYLDGSGHWQLDAGRYEDQRYATGGAIDPQTWRPITDHEVAFLSERFRALPSYQQSRVQEEFASDFLQAGLPGQAAAAARRAVGYERRNLAAWQTLVEATRRLGTGAEALESVLKEAGRAFTPKYPDLAVAFENQAIASLRARGQTSLAAYEERGLAERLRGTRGDLAVAQAAAILARSMATETVEAQVGTYNGILAQFGQGAGVQFFDQVVRVFAAHLESQQHVAEAREAVERAARVMSPEPGSQLANEFDNLIGTLHP